MLRGRKNFKDPFQIIFCQFLRSFDFQLFCHPASLSLFENGDILMKIRKHSDQAISKAPRKLSKMVGEKGKGEI